MSQTDSPAPDEVEISLLGPGVGESIVVHLGFGDWIVVDSCRGRGSSRSAPLEYLERMGVDAATQVKRTVATHAHNDHIQGIAELFEACEAADFVHPAASGNSDFYTLLGLDEMSESSPYAYSEYRKVLDIVMQREAVRHKKPLFGVKDGSTVYRRWPSNGDPGAEALALAPSEEAVRQAIQVFKDSGEVVDLNPYRVMTGDPNTFCAVIWISVGSVHALLGSDLLVGVGADTGWKGVLLSANKPPVRASCFKVPHHGAPNADHPPVWEELLESNPLTLLTPYWTGKVPRPSLSDQSRLCARTDRAFITCKPSIPAQPDSVQKEAAYLRSVATNVRLERGFIGQVRARRKIDGSDEWRVDLMAPARTLCN